VGGVVCRLVQPSAPPQRHQVRDASATSQRRGRRDLSASRCRVRARPPAKPMPLVTIHTLLASARSGLDQSTTSGRRIQTSYIDDGCLNSSRSIIFPGSHRGSPGRGDTVSVKLCDTYLTYQPCIQLVQAFQPLIATTHLLNRAPFFALGLAFFLAIQD